MDERTDRYMHRYGTSIHRCILNKDLIRKHYRDFVKFINDIPFDKLNAE
jgi:hypothetical protein